MGNLLVNTRDQQFLLFEQFGIEKVFDSEAYGGYSKDDVLMILSEAEKMAVNDIFPTLKEGDEEGCHIKDGKVTVPKCFREPFKKYSEAGWINPMDSPDVGGQGLPHTAGYAVSELFCAANYAFMMYPGLTHGAANLINVYGNEEQKKKYMAKCFSGEWTGTMCLTEPGAGSDVGALKTTAKRLPDGKFLITGTKCFISAGDHDLTPNIIHPVLARIEGDPAGTKGISIFIVPKIRVNDDGSLGEFNDVNCGGIEHKMGIKASATATLNFGEDGKCIGELLGEERSGIKIMFQMMNEARLGVGMQGVAIGSAAFQHAVSYAKERIQGTPVWEMKNPAAKAVTIINHPDVRKKLMWMKSHVEGIRALAYFGAYCMDMSKIAKTEAESANWEGYLELLTPIIKSYSTDKGLLICSLAMDVYGGYGYCSEYPVEQFLRDEKIACIYEGTNGIQALDFVGRKLGQRKGANVMNMAGLVQKAVAKYKNNAELGKAAATLEEASNACFEVAMFFAAAGKGGDFIAPIYNAGKYLDIFGDMVVGYLLLDAAGVAQEKLNAMYDEKGLTTIGKQKGLQRENQDAAFYAGKIASA
ncbi:MAG TPA: acyl-CoA dehydrogenase, partial [Smithellaceae bacterium]|nr:acyl-CoA dehydrogenase [Smithellaceae bacterium]HPE07770.1 acyl-CoA dehydrogenase [Smithellaceae bacterium]HRY37837.1 acyl-CoA dehydrogenase [Smithellaceae bacterium]